MDEKIGVKKVEINISLKKGEIFTSDTFIKKLGLDKILDDDVRRARFFYEILTILNKFDAIKRVGKQKIRSGRGRRQYVYKAIKNISFSLILEEE